MAESPLEGAPGFARLLGFSFVDLLAYVFAGVAALAVAALAVAGWGAVIDFVEAHRLLTVVVTSVIAYPVGFCLNLLGERILRLWYLKSDVNEAMVVPDAFRNAATESMTSALFGHMPSATSLPTKPDFSQMIWLAQAVLLTGGEILEPRTAANRAAAQWQMLSSIIGGAATGFFGFAVGLVIHLFEHGPWRGLLAGVLSSVAVLIVLGIAVDSPLMKHAKTLVQAAVAAAARPQSRR
jgi:hypothetical protein